MAKHRNLGSLDEADDLDEFLDGQLDDPAFRGAYEDAEVRSGLLRIFVSCRKDARLTQQGTADIMGTTQSAVSDLENGATDPRLSTLQRYARAVGGALRVEVIRPGGESYPRCDVQNAGGGWSAGLWNVIISSNAPVASQWDRADQGEVCAFAKRSSHLTNANVELDDLHVARSGMALVG
jgi:transcriptional regulator with XRE-family HTH domain